MSNLSELLPAGSSVKSADFVAQGTLASGVTVALRSDGKVEAITGQSGSVGTKVVFEAAVSQQIGGTYDSANNKVVLIYRDDGNSYYGTAIVGTVSGTAITFGSAVVFNSGTAFQMDITFDSNVNKVVIGFRDGSNSNAGTGIVGTVSGTSISFGSEYVFSTPCQYVAVTFDSNSNKVVFGYKHHTTDHAMAIVGTVSGTAISYGSEATFNAVNSSFNAATFDSNSNKVVMFCQQATDGAGKAAVGTISGTSISFGTAVTYASSVGTSATYRPTFDSNSNKVVIGYSDSGNANYGTAIVGTVSGTSISFGTPVVFDGAGNALYIATVFDSVSNKIVISYRDDSVSNSGTVITGTVSGTSISFSGQQVYNSSSTDIAAVFDVNANATVSAYYDGTNSNHGTASVTTTAFTNVSSYVGITDQAISSAATGKVVCKGGAITNTGLLPFAPVAGTPATFDSSTSSYSSTTFDSNANKIVIAYQDGGNSNYGTAVVGTVSGSSISFGTPVVFRTVAAEYISASFDSTANRVNIVYANAGDSNRLESQVGTVSGTSISFGGGPIVINGNNTTTYISSAFDANANRLVVCWKNHGNSNYGTAAVGTYNSGTDQQGFGTPVVFNSGTTEYTATTFDSNSNKVVVSFRDDSASGHGKAVVGTVSGTSVSFGAEVTFNAGGTYYVSSAFDSSSNKIVCFFQDGGDNGYGKAIVGTVSGTSISYGAETRVGTSTSTGFTAVVFDPDQNKTMLAYRGTVNSSFVGQIAVGTVSGTSITVGTEIGFDTGNAAYIAAAYDTNANKTVLSYLDYTPSTQGSAVVIDLTNALTPNTAYFVQDDGTISTTSSTTKAGTALSTTSLLLTG